MKAKIRKTFSTWSKGLSMAALNSTGLPDETDDGTLYHGGTWHNAPKLLRLAFHDCVPYIGDDGSVSGGCDGCINWAGMGFGYSGFPGGDVIRDYYPVDKVIKCNPIRSNVIPSDLIYFNPI